MELKTELKEGDIVVLKSGGEPMTVTELRGQHANVVYMSAGEVKNLYIPKVALLVLGQSPKETLNITGNLVLVDEGNALVAYAAKTRGKTEKTIGG